MTGAANAASEKGRTVNRNRSAILFILPGQTSPAPVAPNRFVLRTVAETGRTRSALADLNPIADIENLENLGGLLDGLKTNSKLLN